MRIRLRLEFMLAVLSGGSAWLAVTFSIYARYFVPLTPAMSKVMSIALIAALSAVNYVGVREGAWVQRTFTYLKIAALLVLIGLPDLPPRGRSSVALRGEYDLPGPGPPPRVGRA